MVFHPEAELEIAGRYRLVQRIGGDVLGVLWEGVRLGDERPVVLELLRSEGVGQEAVSHVWRAAMLIERIEAFCVDSTSPLDAPGSCSADASHYLAALHEVGFRCARSEP